MSDLATEAKRLVGTGDFDPDWYASHYGDVPASIDPVEHYLRIGKALGRQPRNQRSASALKASADRTVPAKPELRGHLDSRDRTGVLSGWLANVGEPAPRVALLKIDETALEILASNYRSDLQRAGINSGHHGWVIPLPLEKLDGKKHLVRLFDKETGKELHRREITLQRPVRSYRDFQSFLHASMTAPEVRAPFVEEDKRAFANMEFVGNKLASEALALSEPPLVSVVMAAYNREHCVAEAIKSVLNQTYTHFELLVVDDGSEDGTAEVVKAFMDPRVRLIELKANSGLSAARNAGFRSASGEIIAYLDSDNTWDRRFIAANVGAMARLPDADAIYSGVLMYYGGSPTPFGMRYGHFNRALLENRNFIDSNVIVHRRSLISKVGGYDEGVRRYVDHDFMLRSAFRAQIYSVPFLMCHYYYDKVQNTITSGDPSSFSLDRLNDNLVISRRLTQARVAALLLARRVTVIIPSWQSPDDLSECLEALDRHAPKDMVSVLIVDNDSDSETRAVIQAFEGLPNVSSILLDKNYGFTFAVNKGIEAAAGDSDILLLNNDAIVQAGAIGALQAEALSADDIGITVPRQILPAGTKTIETHVPFATPHKDCDVNISAHHGNIDKLPIFHDGGPIDLSFAPFFATYIKREVLKRVGLLDAEHGRHYRSDRVYADMVRHIGGFRIRYVPDAHVVHKLQRSTEALKKRASLDGQYQTMFQKNQWDPELASRLGFHAASWDL